MSDWSDMAWSWFGAKSLCLGESFCISLKFVPKGLINNIPVLILVGAKPLSEPMMVIGIDTKIEVVGDATMTEMEVSISILSWWNKINYK